MPVAGHTLPPAPAGFLPEDLEAALAELGETFDVAREDLDLLVRLTEERAAARRAGVSERCIDDVQGYGSANVVS